jgi:hypothetical protein
VNVRRETLGLLPREIPDQPFAQNYQRLARVEQPGCGSDLLEVERVGYGYDVQRTRCEPVLLPNLFEQTELCRDDIGQVRFDVADRAAVVIGSSPGALSIDRGVVPDVDVVVACARGRRRGRRAGQRRPDGVILLARGFPWALDRASVLGDSALVHARAPRAHTRGAQGVASHSASTATIARTYMRSKTMPATV